MADLTKSSKPKRPNPLLIFAFPAAETLVLVAWWLYALTHMVHFPGDVHYSDGSSDNGNVLGFNIVLVIVVVASWCIAALYYDWRKKESR